MVTIIAFVVVLGILVFIHEFGHFIVAKWAGVRVERFSIGFGPSIYRKRYGETEYQVACIPLGGYVKMSGEDPSEELQENQEDDENREEIPPERMFHRQPLPKRFAIVVAGPMMNILLALALVPLAYMIGFEVETARFEKPLVGFIDNEGPAAKAGIERQDLILTINGKKMSNWKKTQYYIVLNPEKELHIKINRQGKILTKTVVSDVDPKLGGGTIGIYPQWPTVIDQILPGKPAEKAGLKAGDRIIQLAEIQHPHWAQTQARIQASANKPLNLKVERQGKVIDLTVTPQVFQDIEGLKDKGSIGIAIRQQSQIRKFGFIEAIKLGTQDNIENGLLAFVVVGKLLTGGLNIKTVGGPVQIAEVTGAAARQGLTPLMLFMAFISLQLAILNLLPIPVLDGGHIFFMTIEGLKGSPLSIKKRLIAQQVGFALLITLMVVVTINDVARHKTAIFGFFKDFIP